MSRAAIAGLALALLSACGADGPPQPPPERESAPAGAITLTGQGRVGVTASN